MNIETATQSALDGHDLDADTAEQLIGSMLANELEDQQIANLLLAVRAKGEAVSELVGAARALRRHMTPIASDHRLLLDTCGTGGDGSGTFNISTAAAIVTAAAGVPVAKHGNRAITSRSGSADVLSELGVNIQCQRETVRRSLDQVGICFCYAPLLHPAMRHVAEIRRSLGVPTLFNLLGPLCNPAGASHQLLGTGNAQTQQKLAAALQQLGTERSAVVRGDDGLDEVSLSARTSVLLVQAGATRERQWRPSDFGLSPIDPQALLAHTPEQSAAMIRQVLDGQPGAPRDIVVANAAASLWLCGACETLSVAAIKCAEVIDSGAASKTLASLVAITTS